MPEYADALHRPHAIHTNEIPTTPISRGPEAIVVTLDTWGPQDNLFLSMYDSLQANWGESPSRTIDRQCTCYGENCETWQHRMGWCRLTKDEQSYVLAAFKGKTLPQILEGIQFHFCFDGVTRAETHQLVRTRIGAAFMQHGGRDNDWRHRGWSMPETIARVCEADFAKRTADRMGVGDDNEYPVSIREMDVCVRNWSPIERYVDSHPDAGSLREGLTAYLAEGKRLYAAMVDAGIPWQDARRVLWMGTQTYIHGSYTWAALRGVLGNRLEHIMDWEINCVAQLMLREIKMKCPPIFGEHLGSLSDMAGKAMMAGLESWPPDGKWPSPFDRCKVCNRTEQECFQINQLLNLPDADHPQFVTGPDSTEPIKSHTYDPIDSLPRQHTRAQMPFWVLSPESMAGGPIMWIPTNGVYPHEEVTRRG